MGVWRAGPERVSVRHHNELLSIHGESIDSRQVYNTDEQIPSFYQLLDRCDQVLDSQSGLMGVVDFYTSRDAGNKERVSWYIACQAHFRQLDLRARQCLGLPNGSGNAGSRWTMSTFTAPGEVSLFSSRFSERRRRELIPDYLEYKMGCVKTYNARNNFLGTYLISIPYYVFLGCSRRRDASAAVKSFETQAGNRVGQGQGGLLTPLSPFTIVEGKEQPSA
jgi:betaine lipid synthase